MGLGINRPSSSAFISLLHTSSEMCEVENELCGKESGAMGEGIVRPSIIVCGISIHRAADWQTYQFRTLVQTARELSANYPQCERGRV